MPELERALRELGGALALPPEPELAPAVARRLHGEEPVGRRLALTLLRRRPVAIALAALAVALAAAAAVPAARTALLELLRIGGVSVERVEQLPPLEPRAPLALGRRVTLAEAGQAVDFPLRVPARAEYGPPDAVYLAEGVPGGAVSLLYGSERSVRLLVTELRGSLEPDLVKKVATERTEIVGVVVRDVQGYWLRGAPHAVFFRDRSGEVRESRYRLAANVLLWAEGGVTYRIEGRLELAEALRVARSLR